MVPIWTTRSPMSSDWGASTVVHPAADRCGWIGRSPYLSMRVGGGSTRTMGKVKSGKKVSATQSSRAGSTKSSTGGSDSGVGLYPW
jgi:hypothetical protein